VRAADVELDTAWAKCADCQEVFQVPELLSAAKSRLENRNRPIERPFDAKIEILRTDSQLLVSVPSTGMNAGLWSLLGFATFWTAFIAFWTFGAAGGFEGFKNGLGWEQLVFACFSIPFWFVGIGMLSLIVYSAYSERKIAMDPTSAVFEWKCLRWQRVKSLHRYKVQAARISSSFMQSDQPRSPRCSVEIVYEQGSFVIPCQTESEQSWVIDAINSYLKEVPPLT
jgi:hypothetical protein